MLTGPHALQMSIHYPSGLKICLNVESLGLAQGLSHRGLFTYDVQSCPPTATLSCPRKQFYHYHLMFCSGDIQRHKGSICVCVCTMSVYCLQHLKSGGIDTNAESVLDIVLCSKTMVLNTNMHLQRALFWIAHGNYAAN